MDETWLHHYDPETKEQSTEWRHRGEPCPKKFRTQKSTGKVMAPVFWDKEGIIIIDYLQKGKTINADYYTSLLEQLKQKLKEKRRGKLSKGVCFCKTMRHITKHIGQCKNLTKWGLNFYITHPILQI